MKEKIKKLEEEIAEMKKEYVRAKKEITKLEEEEDEIIEQNDKIEAYCEVLKFLNLKEESAIDEYQFKLWFL